MKHSMVYKWCLMLVCGGMLLTGHAQEQNKPKGSAPSDVVPIMSIDQLHAALKENNRDYTGDAIFETDGSRLAGSLAGTSVTNLAALRGQPFVQLDLSGLPLEHLDDLEGMPLIELFLEHTGVSDLSVLKGMPLKKLYLNGTPVTDLTPLAGMPLEFLCLMGMPVTNIDPLKNSPVVFLWLNETPVTDISALSSCSNLYSLTLHKTAVTNLSPLAGLHQLKRLHVGETPVQNLEPISTLSLQRLIFTPSTVTNAIRTLNHMPSVRELGTTFENRTSPKTFWINYRDGRYD